MGDTLRASRDILDTLASLVLDALDDASFGGGDFSHVDDVCREALASGTQILNGMGFLAEGRAVDGAPYWARWWARTPDGETTLNEHELDPNSESFYEYTEKPWFSRLRDGMTESVYGPYVDVNGTNDYTLTLSHSSDRVDDFSGWSRGTSRSQRSNDRSRGR